MAEILVVAAHPDDEVLGCGGTMAKHVLRRDKVKVLIMTGGIAARDLNTFEKNRDVDDLKERCLSVHKFLGTTISFADFPDNKMDSIPLLNIVKFIERNAGKPEVVYTHSEKDLNIDHQLVSRAVRTAFRPMSGCSVKSIYNFEVPSATEWGYGFKPNVYKEIDIHKKIKALRHYHSEMRPFPHPRSYVQVKALATMRGGESGLKSAEAFELQWMR